MLMWLLWIWRHFLGNTLILLPLFSNLKWNNKNSIWVKQVEFLWDLKFYFVRQFLPLQYWSHHLTSSPFIIHKVMLPASKDGHYVPAITSIPRHVMSEDNESLNISSEAPQLWYTFVRFLRTVRTGSYYLIHLINWIPGDESASSIF